MSANPPFRTVEQVLATGYRIDSFSVLSRSWALVQAGMVPFVLLTLGGGLASLAISVIFKSAPTVAQILIGYIISPIIMGALMVGTRRLMLGSPCCWRISKMCNRSSSPSSWWEF